jgi:rsbT co-antagonist protein RsbR
MLTAFQPMSENPEIVRLEAENARLRRRIAEQDEERQRLVRLLQTTIDHVDAVIYLRDAEGRFTHVNETYVRTTGLSREAVLGRRDCDVFPKEVYEKFRIADNQVISELRAVEQEEHLPHDDEVHVYRSYKYPVLGENGELIAQGGISTDLTRQRQAEETLLATRAILQAIIDNAPLAILATNRDNRYVLVSTDAARQVGLLPKDILGRQSRRSCRRARRRR